MTFFGVFGKFNLFWTFEWKFDIFCPFWSLFDMKMACFRDLEAPWKGKIYFFYSLFSQECVLYYKRYKSPHSLPYKQYSVSLWAKCVDKSSIQPSFLLKNQSYYWPFLPYFDLFLTFFAVLGNLKNDLFCSFQWPFFPKSGSVGWEVKMWECFVGGELGKLFRWRGGKIV